MSAIGGKADIVSHRKMSANDLKPTPDPMLYDASAGGGMSLILWGGNSGNAKNVTASGGTSRRQPITSREIS